MTLTSTQCAIENICLKYQSVIIEKSATRLRIATAESPPTEMMAALRFATQATIEIECWPQARLAEYMQHSPFSSLVAQTSHNAPERINQLLLLAVQQRASDIHLEPQADLLQIRLRIDGVLQSIPSTTTDSAATLVARLKILAGLDIAEKRIPQDGQFNVVLNGKSESFRLSTLSVRFGEKAVIRLLQGNARTVELQNLGMPATQLRRYKDALSRPQGLILVTGPTGSGKTFTLYSGLSWLNAPQRNLCSVEDPIEIPLTGVNQTQVHLKSGLDFSRVLRALLRQDPDVIMLGEIRDGQTAEIAIKAAQTGHLVLSTLHTNSTTDTLSRMTQMGIPGYLLASALKLVIAQRLVRRLCQHCREPAEAVAHLPAAIWPGTVQNWRAAGCEQCHSGFYGRVAIFELLPITPRIQNAILLGTDPATLSDLAQQQGMQTLYAAGLHCVNRGETTLEELNRVVGMNDG